MNGTVTTNVKPRDKAAPPASGSSGARIMELACDIYVALVSSEWTAGMTPEHLAERAHDHAAAFVAVADRRRG